jgi:AmmeMemoRadiSam system protein B
MHRKPAVSGMFYPSGKKALEKMLSGLFAGVKGDGFRCVVSPHAGYQYSGRTAAYAMGSLAPAKTFVILGPNHNSFGHEFSVMSSGEWETPLGRARIDTGLASQLKKCGILEDDALAHAHEHSIEVQLPFLQYRLGDFMFVPVSITNIEYSDDFLGKCALLGKHIAKTIGRRPAGIIASSDFSHYLPAEIADKKDSQAIEKIAKLDASGFFRALEESDASVCGYGPVAVAMSAAKAMGMKGAKVLNHTNSGDATGDYSSVVSYYAIGFR